MKKLLIAILAAFVTIWVTDILIHQVLLASSYAATKSLWRTEDEMMARMHWMFVGQLIVSAGFATIYVKALAEKACIKCAFFFGLCIGLIQGGGQVIMFAVAPYPGSLVAKWVAACLIQSVVVALVLFKVCKPRAPAA